MRHASLAFVALLASACTINVPAPSAVTPSAAPQTTPKPAATATTSPAATPSAAPAWPFIQAAGEGFKAFTSTKAQFGGTIGSGCCDPTFEISAVDADGRQLSFKLSGFARKGEPLRVGFGDVSTSAKDQINVAWRPSADVPWQQATSGTATVVETVDYLNGVRFTFEGVTIAGFVLSGEAAGKRDF